MRFGAPKSAKRHHLIKRIFNIKKVRHHDQSDEINEMKMPGPAFAAHHPKFPPLLNAIVRKGIQEGTIFEFKVTSPDGQELVTNMRLSSEDIELWKEISKPCGNLMASSAVRTRPRRTLSDVLIDSSGAALIRLLGPLFWRHDNEL